MCKNINRHFPHISLTSVSQHLATIDAFSFNSSFKSKKLDARVLKMSNFIFIHGVMVSDKPEASPQCSIFIAVKALINFSSWHFLIDWQSAACDRHLEDRYSSITPGVALISWWDAC